MNIIRQWKSVRFGGKSEEASLAWPDRLGGKMSRFREAIAMESADVRDSARVTRRKSTRRLSITIFSVDRPPDASLFLPRSFSISFQRNDTVIDFVHRTPLSTPWNQRRKHFARRFYTFLHRHLCTIPFFLSTICIAVIGTVT